MNQGLPPSITHPSASSNRLCNHLYMKQTNDGKIICGGDRVVSSAKDSTNFPINVKYIENNKAFATRMYPFLAKHPVADQWTGLMPFSPDSYPIIGKVSCLPGQVFIISGMASAGMMKGPGAG